MRGKKKILLFGISALFFGLIGCVNMQRHFVSTPSTPSGPSSGDVGQLLTYSTGGASCSEGHQVEYRFDWGDGTYSPWSPSTTASKAWNSAGTYQIKAQARCATDNSVISGWSSAKSVTVTAPAYGGIGATIDNGKIAITLRRVRTANRIGILEPDPGRIFLIVDLKALALRGNQYVSVFTFKLIQSDGRVNDASFATVYLDHPFEGANLNAGQWTDGEIAFEVYPGQAYYILEYNWIGVAPIRFRFSL